MTTYAESASQLAVTALTGRVAVPSSVIRMSRRVLAVDPDTDPALALAVMRRNEIHHLPVVSGSRCVGLLTETDLLEALAVPEDLEPPPVGELCHMPPPTVPAGSPLSAVAAAILAGGLNAVLVVRGSVLIGIATSADVLAQVADRPTDGSEDST